MFRRNSTHDGGGQPRGCALAELGRPRDFVPVHLVVGYPAEAAFGARRLLCRRAEDSPIGPGGDGRGGWLPIGPGGDGRGGWLPIGAGGDARGDWLPIGAGGDARGGWLLSLYRVLRARPGAEAEEQKDRQGLSLRRGLGGHPRREAEPNHEEEHITDREHARDSTVLAHRATPGFASDR